MRDGKGKPEKSKDGRPVESATGHLAAEAADDLTLTDSSFRFRIPKIQSRVHLDDILIQMDRTFKETPLGLSWIIDVSEMERTPYVLALVGSLVAYQLEFRTRGQEVILENVPVQRLGPVFLKRLKRFFTFS